MANRRTKTRQRTTAAPGRSGLAARVRHALSLDAAAVVDRLTTRQEEMVSLFSRLRNRAPLLVTLESAFASITFTELAALEPQEQSAVNEFYRQLAELRWYVSYTEDMPLQLKQRLFVLTRELLANHNLLNAVLGATVPGQTSAAKRRARGKKLPLQRPLPTSA